MVGSSRSTVGSEQAHSERPGGCRQERQQGGGGCQLPHGKASIDQQAAPEVVSDMATTAKAYRRRRRARRLAVVGLKLKQGG